MAGHARQKCELFLRYSTTLKASGCRKTQVVVTGNLPERDPGSTVLRHKDNRLAGANGAAGYSFCETIRRAAMRARSGISLLRATSGMILSSLSSEAMP